jgi:hypothetical protein
MLGRREPLNANAPRDPTVSELDEHFFRRESGRMIAALTRIFGVHNLALAQDVAQDAGAGRSRHGASAASPHIPLPGS